MKTANVEVFADARPIPIPNRTITGSSFSAIAGKAARSVKLKRGVRQLTIRMNIVPRPSMNPDLNGDESET